MVQCSRICIVQGARARIFNVQGSRVGVVQCAMCLLEVPKCFNSQHAPYCAKTSFQDKQGTSAHLPEHFGHFKVRKMSKLCILDGGQSLRQRPPPLALGSSSCPKDASNRTLPWTDTVPKSINLKYCKYNPESLVIVSHCIVSQIIQKLKMSKVVEFWPNFFRT